MIPYGRQSISEADIQAVVEILRSDWLTQGPAVPRFEQALADYCGANHGVAVSSATAALHLACLALDVGTGDRLWTTPNTFVASANCALYCGAEIDFVDIDPRTYNLDVHALAPKLETAEKQGTLPKVVIPVHFAGQSCEMDAIHELAQRYGFRIIEDASHAIGGRYRGEPIGSGRYSDITVFSFHPVKIITTGEGGMALTNNSVLAERMRRLRTHGITRDVSLFEGKPQGAWDYQQIELGYNLRMTDMQAALGTSQMQRLDEFVNRRTCLAQRYDQLLSELPVVRPWQHSDTASAWHLYVIQIQQALVHKTRKEVFDRMRHAGIGVNVHYIPVHTQPHYRKLGFQPGQYPKAESYYANAISLPLYFGLTEKKQDRVIHALSEALQ